MAERIVDSRDFMNSSLDDARRSSLEDRASAIDLFGGLAVSVVEVDAFTTNPRRLQFSQSEGLVDAPTLFGEMLAAPGFPQLLGLDDEQGLELSDPVTFQAAGGGGVVNANQLLFDIPILGASLSLEVSAHGGPAKLGSTLVRPAVVDGVEPIVGVGQAVVAAAEHLAATEDQSADHGPFDISQFVPSVESPAEGPDLVTALVGPPFLGQLTASLGWFWMPERTALVWSVGATPPGGPTYQVVIDETAAVVACARYGVDIAAQGNVFEIDGDGSRVIKPFPLPANTYPRFGSSPLGAFPVDWVAKDSTDGPLAFVVSALKGTPGTTLTFNSALGTSDEQAKLNSFFLYCKAHDWFHTLGFNQGVFDGSTANPTRFVLVDALGFPDPALPLAKRPTPSWTPPQPPRNAILELAQHSRTARSAGFDATVVYHEAFHGVTDTIVEGVPPALRNAADHTRHKPYRALAEGWADFAACQMTGRDVIGAFWSGVPTGLRDFRYDASFSHTFAELGKLPGTFTDFDPFAPHNVGQLWCATLMEIARRIGSTKALQLVYDGLHVSQKYPNFLHARDGIRTALDNWLRTSLVTASEYQTLRADIQATFSKMGLGPGAKHTTVDASGQTIDNVEDFRGFVSDTSPFPPQKVNAGSGSQRPGLRKLTQLESDRSSFVAFDDASSAVVLFSSSNEGRDVFEVDTTDPIAGCTILVPFSIQGQDFVFAYVGNQASGGKAPIWIGAVDGQSLKTLRTGSFSAGFSNIFVFNEGGHPHLLQFNLTTKQVDIDRIEDDGITFASTMQKHQWAKPWSSFVPFDVSGTPHYLSYRRDNGEVDIDKVGPGATTFHRVSTGQIVRDSGWSELVSIPVEGQPHYLAHDPASGLFSLEQISVAAGSATVEVRVQGQDNLPLEAQLALADADPVPLLAYQAATGFTSTDYLVGLV